MTSAELQSFRRRLDASTLQIVDELRGVIASSCPDLTETFKWNAPNFELNGVDRITLGISKGGEVRIVLHRGAKPKESSNFRFVDESGLVRWVAADRGTIVFSTLDQVERCRTLLRDLFSRWVSIA
jgi:hypothetical protein